MQGEARRKVIDTIWSQLMSLDKDTKKKVMDTICFQLITLDKETRKKVTDKICKFSLISNRQENRQLLNGAQLCRNLEFQNALKKRLVFSKYRTGLQNDWCHLVLISRRGIQNEAVCYFRKMLSQIIGRGFEQTSQIDEKLSEMCISKNRLS